ncbi:MAG: LysR family transcriptional regulator [Actinobacteria bacterium]|nr:LysR family transcriptional regulator [Actinomycetota bacterium]
MELRQLRYFVTLADELHFGRAAAREHIVQSALSQQIQRLERELDVRLLERNTHHVRLTPGGAALLVEARQLLSHAERAAEAARSAARVGTTLRVGVVDGGYDSMPLILRAVQERHPDLEIHQREVGVPEQYRLLAEGHLEVGFGRASLAPPEVASALFRLDPMGVLLSPEHPMAQQATVPVSMLATEPVLLSGQDRAPEFNQFVIELCRSVGFGPVVYRGSVDSIRAAVDLVARRRCVVCVPASCVPPADGLVWRLLVEPLSRYPWSVLWRASDHTEHTRSVVDCAHQLSQQRGWLDTPDQAGIRDTAR